MATQTRYAKLCLDFGASEPGVISAGETLRVAPGLRLLKGKRELTLPGGAVEEHGPWTIVRAEKHTAGFLVVGLEEGLQEQVAKAYDALFDLTRDQNLYRVWNFVPQINNRPAGLENYARFCAGRSESFFRFFGEGARTHMPAASGVGAGGEHFVAAFVSGRAPARHVENPLQMPAYDYPRQYGPRSPSFARATIVEGRTPLAFLSGTAAIRGHESQAPGDVRAQTRITVENLQALMTALREAGFDSGRARQRSFVAYVREAGHETPVREVLAEGFLRPGDTLRLVRTEICRSELEVEIEGFLADAP